MHTSRWLLLWLLALCAAPAAATAQDGVVVASDGPAALSVRDAEKDLCLAIKEPNGEADACSPEQRGVVALGAPSSTRAPSFIGAAVPVAATTVEVRRTGKLLASGPTIAGEAYRGRRAGSVRFALLRLPATVENDGLRVRALDASGAPVAVFDPGHGELITERRALLSGRSGRVRWSVESQRKSSLTSTVYDLDHETVSRCLEIKVKSPRVSGSSEGLCTGGAPQDAALESVFGAAGAMTEDECDQRFRLLHGVVQGTGSRVSVLLGDGQRLPARSARFEEADKTVFALVVPAAAAIRGLRVQRPGTGARRVAFSVPPLAFSCATGAQGFPTRFLSDAVLDPAGIFADLPPVRPTGPVAAVAGSPGFRVADGPAESLCLAVADLPFTALTCGIMAPGFTDNVIAVDDYVRPRAFVLAVPAQVARLRLGPKRGPARELPTIAAEGYTGRYAGHVRFVAATITSFRELERMEQLDAFGKVLHKQTSEGSETGPRVFATRRIAGARGRASLWETPVRAGGETSRCLALTGGPRPSSRTRCQTLHDGPITVLVDAPCSTRRLTVAVVARAGWRASMRSGAGAARPLPLRAGSAVLTLPPATGLRSLTFRRRGKRPLRVSLNAPAATDQCGWGSAVQPPVPSSGRSS